jgi:serine protease inhibitor
MGVGENLHPESNMVKLRAWFVVAAALLLGGCDALFGPGEPAASWSHVALDERVTDAYGDFGFELYRRLRADEPNANIFVSPTSAAIALTMAYNGAVGVTADEMAHVLGVAHVPLDELNATNERWLGALARTGDPRAELAFANSIWHRADYALVPAFEQRMRDHYSAELQPLTTAEPINAWVRQHTRNRIESIIDAVDGKLVALLVNALYFKADWTQPFDARMTQDAPFHLAGGGTTTVPMMEQTGAFEAHADGTMSLLQLPYGAERFSMLLALPAQGRTLADVAEALNAADLRNRIAALQKHERLVVRLPRFEVEWESSLKDVLRAMGMDVPFEAGLADFSNMFTGGGPWIGDVLQKTWLRVDEKGTEAAAVTSVSMIGSMPPELVFDRPFFLAIFDHATDTVLFLGQVARP